MQISRNILKGVVLGLSTIALTTTSYSEVSAQVKPKVSTKAPKKDTLAANKPVKVQPKPRTEIGHNPVIQPIDSPRTIDKYSCITCGRG